MYTISSSSSKQRKIAMIILMIMVWQITIPNVCYGLTSGPSAPETEGFAPLGSSDMVDLFTGGLHYQVPIMDVGGYPITLNYQANPSMEQEASWVGLGWSLTPGAVNRNMRGIPDDFNGDTIGKKINIKDNNTVGVSIEGNLKLFGIPLGMNAGLFFNNYNGLGLDLGAKINSSTKAGNKSGSGLTGGINLNSQSGAELTLGYGLDICGGSSSNLVGVSAGLNSRTGLQSIGYDFSRDKIRANSQGQLGTHSSGSSGNLFTPGFPTYMPSPRYVYRNTYMSLGLTFGGELPPDFHPNLRVTGYYTNQSLNTQYLRSKAYGMMHPVNDPAPDILQDFDREKDMPITKNNICIGVPIATPDIFNVQAEGISGNYQIERNDAGSFFDPDKTDESSGQSFGVEIGVGADVHNGVDLHVNSTTTKSGKWKTEDNGIFNSFNLYGEIATFNNEFYNSLRQGYQFRNIEEASILANPGLYGSLGDTAPDSLLIGRVGPDDYTTNNLNGFVFGSSTIIKRNREKGNQEFSLLSNADADQFGLIHDIQDYPVGDAIFKAPGSVAITTFTHTNTPLNKMDYHVGEIKVISETGSTYFFGIPVYNLSYTETAYRTSERHIYSGSPLTNNVISVDATENSLTNGSGKDHFYELTMTPGYSYAFLLTAVTSPDYSDLTGNGPTEDDLGTYTKFNYHQSSTYYYRTPLTPNTTGTNTVNVANFNEGYNTLSTDQSGTYSTGSKECGICNRLKTRTM